MSRCACSRRAASLRLKQNPARLSWPSAFAFAPLHPLCSRRFRASLFSRCETAWTLARFPSVSGNPRSHPVGRGPCPRFGPSFLAVRFSALLHIIPLPVSKGNQNFHPFPSSRPDSLIQPYFVPQPPRYSGKIVNFLRYPLQNPNDCIIVSLALKLQEC